MWSDGDCWSLNSYEDAGPWSPDDMSPGRMAMKGGENYGWDACCYGDGCDISKVVYDDSNGVGWDVSGWRNSDDGSVWGGGVIYDTCPCNDGDVNCVDGVRQVCMPEGEAFTDTNVLSQDCETIGKPIAYGGFIQDPGVSANYDCKDLG